MSVNATDGASAAPLSIRIDANTRAQLERIALDQQRSVSQVIRFAIYDYLATKATA